MENNCVCTRAGFCERHNIEKTPHMHKLCQNHAAYFNMWEECRGPGQQNTICGEKGIKITRGEQTTEETVPKVEVKLPSLIQQAKNLAVATKNHVLDGMGKVSPEKKVERLSICETCPHLKKESMRCGQCGCMLNTKTEWRTSTCPIGKW